MNYNQLTLKERNFDTEFINFINSYQNLYQNMILEDTSLSTRKRNLKNTLEDFFFTPKYTNVLDLLKLSKI
ncbi:hypothetical protein [Tenacibaculum piscium]|uniref:Uncharacterized protein n=1 Tax=Tenacibaculum piscium TaxID=1458515 RepID=A0A2H1YIR1_9FLAO|nr:hypothetical protein [Tenacibaculum piscium]MBE7628602.1 hypothetical protein [Tenacibaculum piscium]MBE7669743.1 hypothetical protein [Tenacibaculum piscium]MBE7684669.1 hypothetical protein [Tenacibaculum piscium]MBE7689289.1 hypothetical protein [Tenacibaculum piscium]MCG8182832.1 hypothetical protein [Tenacibaculum piscium]